MKSFAEQVRDFVQAADGNRRALATAVGTDVRTIDRWAFGFDAPATHDQVLRAVERMRA